MSAENASEPRTAVGLLAALYAAEAAALALAMASYKYSNRFASLTTRQAAWIIVPATVLFASGAYILHSYLKARRSPGHWFGFTLAMNALPVATLLVAGEAAIRLRSVSTLLGVSVGGTVLFPRSWDHVRARNAELLEHAPSNISYFVSDDLLGWTVGPSRRSADGLYLSSVEGIRSGRQAATYAGRQARHRIATVGDSFTFGLDVPFEDSWGNQLERALGGAFEVLNFGVDGYGVDQAYLRYQRDVRRWRPAVAIFGFIEHDLYRSLSVYSFITFPEWGFPFSKPRFVVSEGEQKLLNAPLMSPSAILAAPSVERLPFVEYDPGYDAAEWQWHFYDSSRLVRFLPSRFPRWPSATAALAVQHSAKDRVLAGLRRSGVRPLDLTGCVGAVGEDKAFVPGRAHYSAAGNAAVARCLSAVVR